MASRGPAAAGFLNLLQDILDLESFSIVKPLICKTLVMLSHASGLYPRCFPIPGLHKIGQHVDGGGFADIWKGLVRGGQSVSVKIMRIFREDEVAAVLKEFGREALIWRQLCHPNLLPFFGLYRIENRLCLVSPWMENGNIMRYLSKQIPNIVRRVSLILDVARGLQYLHEKNVVHGDLKAINILVTPSGRACICDFGLASIVNEITLRLHSTTKAQGGTARYYAPELFQGNSKKNFASDIFAFACVCTEILSGEVPFHESPNDMAVMHKILHGERPTRPPSCSGTTQLDTLWELLQNCWRDEADKRPTAAQIVARLVAPSIGAMTTSSSTDWDEQFTCKFRRSSQDRPLLPSVNQIERIIFGDVLAQVCQECFPDRESSKLREIKAGTANLKRRYNEREGTSDSEQGTSQAEAKRFRVLTLSD
ncbi:kinase-like domain-containing protein [Mycena metata]|uniref:Kinase-like domain-containing protein n=1 Tax=Mycena metata TaxID=1033252 RepID=A0AAD7K8F6_9AGAR|nr:kinase-like domain-containing protein [Mycena metata]